MSRDTVWCKKSLQHSSFLHLLTFFKKNHIYDEFLDHVGRLIKTCSVCCLSILSSYNHILASGNSFPQHQKCHSDAGRSPLNFPAELGHGDNGRAYTLTSPQRCCCVNLQKLVSLTKMVLTSETFFPQDQYMLDLIKYVNVNSQPVGLKFSFELNYLPGLKCRNRWNSEKYI